MFADNISELKPQTDHPAGAAHSSYHKDVMDKLHVATQWLITCSVFSALAFVFSGLVSGWLPTLLFSGVFALLWATCRLLTHALRLAADEVVLREGGVKTVSARQCRLVPPRR